MIADILWKEAIEQYFEDLLEFFFPHIHADIDFGRGYEFLDKELAEITQGSASGQRFADCLVKVFLNDGVERWLIIHIEVQGYIDPEFARRMFIYNYRAFDRYGVDVVSLALLADEQRNYRPQCFEIQHWDFHCRFKFPIIKLMDYREHWERLTHSPNPFALLVMAHLKAQETRKSEAERYSWKITLVKMLYERGFTQEDVLRLYRFLDGVLALPEELTRQFHYEIVRYEEEHEMTYITTAERIGMERGHQEGVEQGLREGLLRAIHAGLSLKFGAAGVQLYPDICKVEDINTLEAVNVALFTASDLQSVAQVYQEAA